MKITTRYKSLFYTLIPSLFIFTQQSHAGSDEYCAPNFNLDGSDYNACSNLPVLIPGNDNRTNMTLLLSNLGLAQIKTLKPDLNLWSAQYGSVPFDVTSLPTVTENKINNKRQPFKLNQDQVSYEERCISLQQGKQTFIDQVKANKNIPTAEKQLLIDARSKLIDCEKTTALIAVNPNWSATTRQYASYLNGSILFYNANFSAASKIYIALSQVEDPWLKETAQYMLIRTELNTAFASAQDQYGDINPEKIDHVSVKNFFNNITEYLKLYPQGQYVASARGLMRRGLWLTDRQDLLINEIVWQINHPQSPLYNLEMNQLPAELDRRVFRSEKFNPKLLNEPFFLTTYNLMQMRKTGDEKYKPITWAQLNNQKAFFKTQPELFKYLQAAHLFYVQGKNQEALSYLPKANSQTNNALQLSQQFLIGQILEKQNKVQAQQHWLQLYQHANDGNAKALFETALANHFNQSQNTQAFIGKNAQISQAILQKNFISNFANEDALQTIIQSSTSTQNQKNTAIYTILSKSLDAQNFVLFNQNVQYLPKNTAQYKSYESNDALKEQPPFADFIWQGSNITPQLKCPDLITLSKQLAQSPKNALLNVCLGEYMRHSRYGDYYYSWHNDEQNQFKGTPFARGTVYKKIIKNEPNGDLKAYALYRSVMCYSPNGTNDCGDIEVSKNTRKQWFDQLKRDYPNSNWAKSLKYYW